MDQALLRKCTGRLLSRLEPGLLVPKEPWSPELQKDIARLAPAKDEARQAVKSALLLWNDDLAGCHDIAQSLPDEFGAYLHGIMHRREPDYSNAKHWFRRVGQPPLFGPLLAAARELLADAPGIDAYRKALEKDKTWDPFRMVDWCESATDEQEIAYLRTVQAIEIQGLTYSWLDRAGLPRS